MDAMERFILEVLQQQRDRIVAFARDIYRHPELSDQEHRTAQTVAQAFSSLGLRVQTGLSGTGVAARLGGGRRCVALLGELDAIRCPDHPDADPVTGAAHACGHHAQLAALYGAALALTQPAVREALGGEALFFAVPAEEKYGGKCRLLREGAFDGVDAAVTHHVHYVPERAKLLLGSMPNNGVRFSRVRVTGRAAHAAGAPHEGVNALSATTLALSAIGLQRETYRDEDGVRVHGIITRGGDAANVVPAQVEMDMMVRAKNRRALEDAWEKTCRAFSAGALAMDASVQMEPLFAYAPMRYRAATAWQKEIAALLLPPGDIAEVTPAHFNPTSTDVGDLSERMPVYNFTTGGFEGALHSAAFRMVDEDTALLLPARMMALSAWRLLRQGARALEEASQGLQDGAMARET